MRRRPSDGLLPLIAAGLVISMVLGGLLLIDGVEGGRYREQSFAVTTQQAAAVRARVEQSLNARLFLVRSLVAMVRGNPELTQGEFEEVAAAAAEGISGVRGLALARNAIATHFFPLAGNEQAIGHDLLADPNRRGAILEVIDRRRFLLQGPLPLLQGGEAVIGRLPVVLPDPGTPVVAREATSGSSAGSGRVWGLAVIIIDVETILREAGVVGGGDGAVEFALRGRDGLGASGDVFLGRAGLFGEAPVLADITLPNGSWQLGALPQGGWSRQSPHATTLRLLGVALAAACGFAAWRLVRDPICLRRDVAAARESVLVSERRQSMLVESVEDYAIYMLGANGAVASWNNGAFRIMGHSTEEVMGRSHALFYPPDAAQAGLPESELAAARRRGRHSVERWHLRKDGTRFLGVTTIAAIRPGEGAGGGAGEGSGDAQPLGFSVVTHDLTQRIQIESSLRESNRRFHDIVGVAGEFIWESDAKGRYTFVSERVLDVLGHSPAELLHCAMVDLMVPEDGVRVAALLRDHASTGRPFRHEEFRCLGKDGGMVWLWGSGIPVSRADGEVIGFRGVAQDISDQKLIENRLRRTVEKLERSNVELTRFAEVAAHDLQEPLRIMVSYADLLSRRYAGRMDKDADDFLGFIVDSSVRMKSLIQDLLRYSLIERSDPPASLADIGACIREAAAEFKDIVHAIGARLELPDWAPQVPGDVRQFTEVFRNLLANAIEYRSPDRDLVITVAVKPIGAAWELSVTDNGIGIEHQYYHRIFVVFERLHTQRTHPGTGIGLAICKKIVERHGGTMSVTSDPGIGSTFFLTLPAAAADEHGAPVALAE
ncbi:histidine kinase [Skermanella stibiiresistens SB22]|uniref:histidine kinase n=1 Tax=Skermanella stibiiresistens SB22 TaxID=1385369 RepID=W9H0S8_9PROT|nr:PAS domain S-box protein [Skermanella stibiiresistens]EWY37358.1 histidine kinase [Skermanella stibiiresistens SB22]